MNNLHNQNGNTNLYSLPSLYRGIYNRVAEKIGCDPSYVSRVARGQRTSKAVARALEFEIQQIMKLAAREFSSRPKAELRKRAAR